MIQYLKTSAVAVAFMATAALTAQAQIETPQPSPQSTVTQRVGLTDFTVTYSRPSIKGRRVFGGIVEYDKPWRTGANQATRISFKDPIIFENTRVSPGEYALYTIPGQEAWVIVLNKDTKLGGSMNEYKADQEVVRVKVRPMRTEQLTETFTITFTDITNNSANLTLMWENVMVKAKIGVQYDEKVMASITEAMAGTDIKQNTYYTAARYYYENNKDLQKALEWVNKATAKDPQFWMLHTKAQIQAATNDYKGAIASANQSIELAKKAGNDEYVKMNQEKIAEWTPKAATQPKSGSADKGKKKK